MKVFELMKQYSGITALLIYLPLLFAILRLRQIHREKAERKKEAEKEQAEKKTPLNTEDEDALVASLVASIDYHEKTHQDVRVVSVRKVKDETVQSEGQRKSI